MWDVRRAVSRQKRDDLGAVDDFRDKQNDVEVLEQPQQLPAAAAAAAVQQPPPVVQQPPAAENVGLAGAFEAAAGAPQPQPNIDAAPGINIVPPALPEDRYGDFVANHRMHPGVTLLAQLQHGKLLQDEDNELQGRVTRTGPGRVVKVMCIARCPVGGHFATGSDE